MTNVVYHKKRTVPKKLILFGLLVALFLIVSSILLLSYPFASKDKVDYFAGEYPILFQGKQTGNALVEENQIYVPLSFLKEHIDEQVFFDEQSNSIIITTKDKVVQMPTESLTYYVNENPVELQLPAIKDQNGELYMALDPILPYYQLQHSVLPSSNAVEIIKEEKIKTYGKVQAEKAHEEKLRLRIEPNLQSPYTAQVTHDENILIEDEKEDYYLIRKEDGTAGFIQQKYIDKGETKTVRIEKEEKEDPALPLIDEMINLTWEPVYVANPNTNLLPQMPGVNVVSPTWFELTSHDGTVKNLGSLQYMEWAKQQGYQVWALFSNGFDPKLTHEALKHYETRQKIIRQLLHYSQMYDLDGINIDIENVDVEDGPLVTQFVREATPYFHEAGLVVSMDMTFIADGNWSAFYEREKLAQTVDYLMVMAYDEHWATSPEAGSVASLPWVEVNLQRLLEVVPNEKLILGVPLYARLWEEKETGEVSSKALSMKQVREWVTSRGITPTYDEESGQNYAEYFDEKTNSLYRIWIEDELSLSKRVDLAYQYGLKGVASWSRTFADESAWLALSLEDKQVVQK